MEVLETLESSEHEAFFDMLIETEFHHDVTYSTVSIGLSIKITYDNDDFIVISTTSINGISYGGAILYDSQGQVVTYYGIHAMREQFVNLVNEFFEIEIDS